MLTEYLKEWAYDKLTETALNSFAGWVTGFATALPIITVVGGCVYCLVGMFSKTLAKIAFAGVVIYGAIIIG